MNHFLHKLFQNWREILGWIIILLIFIDIQYSYAGTLREYQKIVNKDTWFFLIKDNSSATIRDFYQYLLFIAALSLTWLHLNKPKQN